MYRDPEYLFLDEATNSLDSINEQKIVTALEKAFVNKTVVVIAHRLSTIRKADQIIVMQDGKVFEIGAHDILIEKKGKYYQLVQSQANIISPLSDGKGKDKSFVNNEVTA